MITIWFWLGPVLWEKWEEVRCAGGGGQGRGWLTAREK